MLFFVIACSSTPEIPKPAEPGGEAGPTEPSPEPQRAPPRIRMGPEPVVDADGNTTVRTPSVAITCPAGWHAEGATPARQAVKCTPPVADGSPPSGAMCVAASEPAKPDATAASHAEAATRYFVEQAGEVGAITNTDFEVAGVPMHRTSLVRQGTRVLAYTVVSDGLAGVASCSAPEAEIEALEPVFERIGRSLVRISKAPAPTP
ncbi:MAG: hypothetical protein R3F61_22620 [Myxococcota bacterium]